MTYQDSMASVDELKDYIVDVLTNDKSAMKPIALKETKLEEKELKKLVDEMIDRDSGEITINVVNKNNMLVQDMFRFQTRRGFNKAAFLDNFKIEIL